MLLYLFIYQLLLTRSILNIILPGSDNFEIYKKIEITQTPSLAKYRNLCFAMFLSALSWIVYLISFTKVHLLNKVRKKAKIRNRYNQAPHLTQDTTWESNKNTIKHHIQERQEVSPCPGGDHKAAMNRQENMENWKHK